MKLQFTIPQNKQIRNINRKPLRASAASKDRMYCKRRFYKVAVIRLHNTSVSFI